MWALKSNLLTALLFDTVQEVMESVPLLMKSPPPWQRQAHACVMLTHLAITKTTNECARGSEPMYKRHNQSRGIADMKKKRTFNLRTEGMVNGSPIAQECEMFPRTQSGITRLLGERRREVRQWTHILRKNKNKHRLCKPKKSARTQAEWSW